jgi:hypothetical protein
MKLLLSTRRSFPAFVGSGTSINRMPFPTGDVRQRQVFYTNIKQTNKGRKKESISYFLPVSGRCNDSFINPVSKSKHFHALSV